MLALLIRLGHAQALKLNTIDQFLAPPSEELLRKLQEYASRYDVELVIEVLDE
jgi:hypothetical protein